MKQAMARAGVSWAHFVQSAVNSVRLRSIANRVSPYWLAGCLLPSSRRACPWHHGLPTRHPLASDPPHVLLFAWRRRYPPARLKLLLIARAATISVSGVHTALAAAKHPAGGDRLASGIVCLMIKTLSRLSMIAILALASASPWPGHDRDVIRPAAAAPTYDFAPATALIEDAMASVPLTGASMLVVKDGDVVYEDYFGTYTPTTIVFIASATKWLSAATFMTLVDDGSVDLDDTVSDYLPEWTGSHGQIRIRQLWSHTSGLANTHACLDDGATTLELCVEQIRQRTSPPRPALSSSTVNSGCRWLRA